MCDSPEMTIPSTRNLIALNWRLVTGVVNYFSCNSDGNEPISRLVLTTVQLFQATVTPLHIFYSTSRFFHFKKLLSSSKLLSCIWNYLYHVTKKVGYRCCVRSMDVNIVGRLTAWQTSVFGMPQFILHMLLL